jgi:hypothetical protein
MLCRLRVEWLGSNCCVGRAGEEGPGRGGTAVTGPGQLMLGISGLRTRSDVDVDCTARCREMICY